MSNSSGPVYEFGPFRLDAAEQTLLRGGEPVPLTPKALQTLLVLVQHAGRVVGKDRLLEAVWADTFVEEGVLTVNVSALRKALGEAEGGEKYIETVPRRGYRFAAPVREASGAEETPRGSDAPQDLAGRAGEVALIVERHTRSQLVVEEAGGEAEPAAVRPGGEEQKALGPARPRPWPRPRAVLAGGVLLAGLVAAAYLWASNRQQGKQALPAGRSIAVLPLKPLGAGEQTENYLGVGLADALITRLGGLSQIRVRPTSSVLRFDHPKQDSLAAARSLGVDAVLEGSYQREGGRVRVTLQLVSARDGAQVWSDTFDDDFTHIFEMEDSISKEVARALAANLSEAEERLLARRPTENVEAYQLYLKGRYFWTKRTEEGLKKGIAYFQQAIEEQPDFALAYSGLADSYLVLCGLNLLPPRDAFPRVKAAAQRSLELDETRPEAHASLADAKFYFDWDWAGAEREYRRAIELNPGYATGHQWYSEFLVAMGRHEEAVAEARRAYELDPLSLPVNLNVGWVFYRARQQDRAIEQFRKTLELDQNFSPAHFFLGHAYEQKGMYEEALAEFQKAISLSGRNPRLLSVLGHGYAVSGRTQEAMKVYDELGEMEKKSYVPSYHFALIHAGLGNKDRAFEWLERAYEERSVYLVFLNADPRLDGLRPDPRFADLLRRVGLPRG